MIFEVQRIKESGVVIDVRAKGRKNMAWGSADGTGRLEIVEMDLTVEQAIALHPTVEDPFVFKDATAIVNWVKTAPQEIKNAISAVVSIGVKP